MIKNTSYLLSEILVISVIFMSWANVGFAEEEEIGALNELPSLPEEASLAEIEEDLPAAIISETLSWSAGSLMFGQGRLEVLYDALAGKDASLLLPSNFAEGEGGLSGDGDGRQLNIPTIELSSLIYYEKDNWVVWANDQLLKKIGEVGSFTLESVKPEQAVFSIHIPKMNEVFSGWKKKMISLNRKNIDSLYPASSEELYENRLALLSLINEQMGWNYASRDGKVAVNSSAETVRVALKPSELFTGKEMSVIFGNSGAPMSVPVIARDSAANVSSGQIAEVTDQAGDVPISDVLEENGVTQENVGSLVKEILEGDILESK